MKKSYILLLLGITLSNLVYSQELSSVETRLHAKNNKEKEVIIADKTLNQLIVEHKSDEAQKYYNDDFLLTTSSGSFITKEGILKEISSPDLQFEINETSEVKVRVHGSTAVLTGVLHQKYKYHQKQFDFKLYVTDTWIETENGWELLSGHATLISN